MYGEIMHADKCMYQVHVNQDIIDCRHNMIVPPADFYIEGQSAMEDCQHFINMHLYLVERGKFILLWN